MLIKVAKFNKQEIPKILLEDDHDNINDIKGVTTISGENLYFCN